MENRQLEKVRKAFDFASFYHSSQMRKDGSSYICHPISSALIAVGYFAAKLAGAGRAGPYSAAGTPYERLCDAVSAGLLHDTVEDTAATLDEIKENFSRNVEVLVRRMTKPEKRARNSRSMAEYFSRLEEGFRAEPALLPLKLSDTLDNSYSIGVFYMAKRERIALEIIDRYLDACYALSPEAAQLLYGNISGYLPAGRVSASAHE